MNCALDKFIKEQYKDLPELSDDILISSYLSSPSVKKRTQYIKKLLLEYGLTNVQSAELTRKLITIPAGTKSHIKGARFNDVIACELKRCMTKNTVLELEKAHKLFHEIPDWIITNGKKTLIGYNQIALHGGGHQLNRGSKYILDDSLHAKLSKRRIKMVCVVKDLPINKQGKSMNILMKGIEKKRIYCIRGLKKLIRDYFCEYE